VTQRPAPRLDTTTPPPARSAPQPLGDRRFLARVFMIVAVGALVGAVWLLSDILLLLFGAILVAIILRALASPLQAHLGLGPRVALLVAGTLPVAILAGLGVWFGPELTREMRTVMSILPDAAHKAANAVGLENLSDILKDGSAASTIGTLATRFISWSTAVAGAIGSVLLAIFGGIYLAIDPGTYRAGFLKLVPAAIQPNVERTLDDAGLALQRWLKGQILAMILVGVFTGAGLWLVGVPSAFALGLIAGLAEFVPIVGPLLAAVPTLLIAGTVDIQTVLLSVAVLVVVQQIESNLITPIIVERMVAIAPAVALFAVVAMGVVFGPPGLLLGFPLTIVLDIAIRHLYVRDTLGEDVKILGAHT
jgi:predicted PurR-regulated permease PerM